VVAHRLSTLRRADWVLVLDEGRIVQSGTHEQLMQRDGHYLEAAALQTSEADWETAEADESQTAGERAA
jgi:ABC-type multidrug transport system fused ATPase/permease subunit